jgi:hypothetical protein
MPWQRWLLIHMLELNSFGAYRFRTVLVLVGRQSGKTTLMAALALWRLLVDGAELVLGTSTNLDYAKMAWVKAADYAEHSPWLAGEFRRGRDGRVGRRTNGEVALEMTPVDPRPGGRKRRPGQYKIATADRKGGRSTSVDLLLLDELREHKTWDAWSASSKTTNARPRGQKVAITNQGDRTGIVLNHLRAVALAGLGIDAPLEPDENGITAHVDPDDTLGIFEWSAPDGCDLDDRQAWAQATPALGYTVEESSIASDQRTDPPGVFRTEVLCQRVDVLDGAIDADDWTACLDETATMDALRSRIALCCDVALDGTHVTLVAAAVRPDGRVQVETIAAWSGPAAVEDFRQALPGHRARIRPRVLGWLPGGPSAALAADLGDTKDPEGRKVTRKGVRALEGALVGAACQGLAQQVKAHRILHNGDPLLRAQVTGAGKLITGDGWRFVRRGGPTVDAAYALAGAVHLARTLPKAVGKPRLVTGSGQKPR